VRRLDIILDKIALNKKSHFWLFLLVLLILSSAMTYFYMPFCPGHDSYFHFRRLQALMDGLNNPYLIYLDYSAIDGYGYFTKAFYSDFILIPFALIGNITGLGIAYQFMLFTMTVLCGIFTYTAVNRIYGNSYAAAISALLYTFAIYRLLDLYHRGALGEALSFTFVPVVFLGLYEIIRGDYWKWYVITTGFSLMILTHVLSSALMFITVVILLAVYCKPLRNEPVRIGYLFLAGLVTLPVVAYYLFPMLEQMAANTYYYQVSPLTSIEENILGTYAIVRGLFSGIVYPVRAFIPGTGLILTCAVALRLFVRGKSGQLRSADIGVAIGFFYIFASSFLFPWSVFPFNKFEIIQMPWRLYEFSCFFFAVAGGYYLSQLLKSSEKRLFAAGILVLGITMIMMLNDSKMYHDVRCSLGILKESTLENNYHLIGLEYLPEKVPSVGYPAERGDSVKGLNAETQIAGYKKTREVTSFDVNINSADSIELPLIYYKGYAATLNGKEMPVSESEHGLVQVAVDRSGRVEAWYKGTMIQKSGYLITIAGITGLCVYIFLQYRNRKKRR
jgi:hypothetical protein